MRSASSLPDTSLLDLAAPPVPGPQAGRKALRLLLAGRGLLSALEALHAEMGDVFQVPLPGFNPVFLVGPQANRFVTVASRNDLRWRTEGDPVTRLLRDGLLVTDGEQHDALRRQLSPGLHRQMLSGYVDTMLRLTDEAGAAWLGRSTTGEAVVDMLPEMRRLALLILMETLFDVDMRPDLERIWRPLLRTLAYISPGPWLVWPGVPRPGYRGALRRMDAYLYRIIAARRARLTSGPGLPPTDILGSLVASGMGDGLIRDQLLTLLIAGHDTSTALLAWTLYLLGAHPDTLQQVQAEVDAVLGGAPPTIESISRLECLEKVIQESLRLYPPIHLGSRVAAAHLEFAGRRIPAGTRVVYSIYLSHRQEAYWPDPGRFDPQRFSPEQARRRPHYTYVPFGGGPRNCIGLAFAQVEVKVILARLLQHYTFQPAWKRVHAHMGATLEPRPGVKMRVRARKL